MAKETPTPFDTSKGAETATYEEVIDYINLAKEFPEINIQAMGSLWNNVPDLYEVILFAGKAKNADIAIAMASIFHVAGEQRKQ